MQKRRLGKTEIEVSEIGLGTVKFGRNQGVKYPHHFELPTDAELKMLLDVAKELNINLLDTAPAYGLSEERLGNLLQGERHKWVISTKVGEEFINGESYFDYSPITIRESVERSLMRLKTDYLDILLVHSDGEDVRIIDEEHVFSALLALKKEGKIRAFGMSTKTVAGGLLTVDMADLVMVAYNANYQDEKPVLVHAKEQQKGVLIKKAFSSGHLSGSISDAVRFALAAPGVTSVIVGTINPTHLRENVAAIS